MTVTVVEPAEGFRAGSLCIRAARDRRTIPGDEQLMRDSGRLTGMQHRRAVINVPVGAGAQGARPDALAERSDAELAELVQSLPVTSARRAAATEVLVKRYEFVVKDCVRRYRESPEPEEDLTQVGYVGLLKAISNFNPEVGTSLLAYAQPCVSGEIKRHFRDKRWQLHVKRSSQEMMLAVREARAGLSQELGRLPEDAEIARAIGVSTEDLAEAYQAEMVFHLRSLDAPAMSAESEAMSLGELIGEEDSGIEHTLDMDAVWTHLTDLPERQQRVLAMRFYGNMTQTEIGQRLGISQMHVSRLLAASLSHLRECLTGGTAPRPRKARGRHRPADKTPPAERAAG
jgi:RNA polymerase sigma-B factor